MNKILFLILIVCGQFSLAQNPEDIDKIKFSYSIGGSSWGNNGIYSRNEIFELAKKENGDFKFISHLKVNDEVRNKKSTKDTVVIKIEKYPIITKNEIQNLLRELNTNRDNYTEEFIKQNFTKPSRNEILKIAKKCDQKDYFKNDYDEKEDIQKKYSQIQEYKYFDEFIRIDKPDIENFELTFDAWNSLGIVTFSNEKTIVYNSQYFKNCGQPISIQDINIKDSLGKQIINLNINLIIQKILPKSSEISKVVDLNSIKLKYINWYMKNKTSEFKY
ncbi:hypothetical protein [Flavobacterium sp. GCM10027622]|uniref:hypothetical protein n=1 Tax=unclassified Flavobacterium TaxID=196869 RepID=UPI00361D9AE0